MITLTVTSDLAELGAAQRRLAQIEGAAAANEGKEHSANPYTLEPFTPAQFFLQLSWSHGWLKQRVSMDDRCALVVEGEAL